MTSKIPTQFDLHKLCLSMTNVIYDPRKMNCLILQNRQLKSRLLLFSNGHLCIHGNDFQVCVSNLKKYTRLICKRACLNISHIKKPKVITISLAHSLQVKSVMLHELYEKLKSNSNIIRINLDLELYPGIIIHYKRLKCTFSMTIFSSGKLIVSGIRKQRYITRYLEPFILELELLL